MQTFEGHKQRVEKTRCVQKHKKMLFNPLENAYKRLQTYLQDPISLETLSPKSISISSMAQLHFH